MKRSIILVVIAGLLIGGGAYYWRSSAPQAASTSAGGGSGRGNSGGGFPGGGGFGGFPGGFGPGGGGPRLPMTVEIGTVKRADLSDSMVVVGNLIGAMTVEALPKVAGRIDSINVKLGDRVTKGQTIAKIDDREIEQQVNQAQAAYDVAEATIKQREALLKQAQNNLDRSRNLYERQLIPRQSYDDSQATFDAAAAQLDLANAQFAQSKARLEELKINLSNTVISSPVTGFVGRRSLDPGAWVTPGGGGAGAGFISVVDLSYVRLVANIVEKDLRRIQQNLPAEVTVDAFPGDKFNGHVAHIAPVLDPATRTAQIEVEIDNPQMRLKPGMYARVKFTVDHRQNALVVPLASLVDVGGNRGVFLPDKGEQGDIAKFHKIETGLIEADLVEVSDGLNEGDKVITTGAAALRQGDRILLPGQAQPGNNGGRGGRGGTGNSGRRGGGGGGNAQRTGRSGD